MAKNNPKGDNTRKGQIKNRMWFPHPTSNSNQVVVVNTRTNRIIRVTKSSSHKGLRKYKPNQNRP